MPEASLFERLAVGLTQPVATHPVTIVIFGGAGDLAHRKLLPALYNLYLDGLLPARFAAVGVGRKEMTDEGYRAFAKDGVTRFSRRPPDEPHRSEEHTSELQSRGHLVCRLLLEKK